jgi:hypothetical protein
VAKADELALDFDHWLTVVTGAASAINSEQRQALADVDQLLEARSGPAHLGFWTDDALRSDPLWTTVRERATRALAAFAWPVERPPDRRR